MGFLARFGRRPVRLPDSPHSWKAGDWAVCVGPDQWIAIGSGDAVSGPTVGEQNQVVRVMILHGRQYLDFAKYPRKDFAAYLFEPARPASVERGMGVLRGLLKKRQNLKVGDMVDA